MENETQFTNSETVAWLRKYTTCIIFTNVLKWQTDAQLWQTKGVLLTGYRLRLNFKHSF